jgi:hypothetical protein
MLTAPGRSGSWLKLLLTAELGQRSEMLPSHPDLKRPAVTSLSAPATRHHPPR